MKSTQAWQEKKGVFTSLGDIQYSQVLCQSFNTKPKSMT